MPRLERVFDGDQDRSRLACELFRHHRVVPDVGRVQFQAFCGGQGKEGDQAEPEEQAAAGRHQGRWNPSLVRHDPPQQRADRERPEQGERRHRERSTPYPLGRSPLRRENQARHHDEPAGAGHEHRAQQNAELPYPRQRETPDGEHDGRHCRDHVRRLAPPPHR